MDFLCKEIGAARTIGAKTDAELLVPVAEWAEMHRNVQNISKMSSVFIGDIDKKDDSALDTILDGLEGVSCILYTTHSHKTPRKEGLACYRVIIELDAEYSPAAHLRLWEAVNRRLGGHLDAGARTPEQGYYLPTAPSGFEQHAEVIRQKGSPWIVAELLAEATTAPSAETEGADLTLTPGPSLAALSSQLNGWTRNQKDLERKEVGKEAKALLAGQNEIPLGQGRRNNFLIRLAGYLSCIWPLCHAKNIASHFQTVGWDLFNADGKYPIESFEVMIERMQAAEREKIAVNKKQSAEAVAETIRNATGGERDYPITPEEVVEISKRYGDWRKHITAVHGKSLYFLRPDGTYDPGSVMRESLFVASRDRLAVFGDHVEYYYEDTQGTERRKTEKMFLEEYGTVIRLAAFDMDRPRGGYDKETSTIFFECAVRRAKAVEHPEVGQWLALLDDHIIDMLSVLPKLGQMLPAMVLTGGRNCGKTLLSHGVGRIYGSDPLDGESAFDKFNASMLTKQPIIFLDETTPDAYKREGTTLLRRFLTQGTRRIEEKYQSRVDLLGYPRILIAANSIDVLNTKEEMGQDDREAFAERIMHIDLDPGKAWLDANAKHVQRYWIKENHIAEHILHLEATHKIKYPGARFAVESNRTGLHDGLASRSGVAGDVAYWLLSFIDSPERALNAHLPIEFSEGKLKVNGAAIVRGWPLYLKEQRSPNPHQIGRALKSMSTGKRQKISITSAGRDRRVDAYVVDPYILRSANDSHGVVEDFNDLFDFST